MTFPPPVPRDTSSRSCRGSPSVFSLVEGRNSSNAERFKGGGVTAPTPAIHFTASERMRELISDISWRKGFYARRAEAREAEDLTNGKQKERERETEDARNGSQSLPLCLPFLPSSTQRLTRASLLCQCCLCQPGRETKHLVLGRV